MSREAKILKQMALDALTERPRVSILISNCNYVASLSDAMDSSLHQTHDGLEVIICDDGSTDASPRTRQHFQALDSRITVVQQPNGGQSLAVHGLIERYRT